MPQRASVTLTLARFALPGCNSGVTIRSLWPVISAKSTRFRRVGLNRYVTSLVLFPHHEGFPGFGGGWKSSSSNTAGTWLFSRRHRTERRRPTSVGRSAHFLAPASRRPLSAEGLYVPRCLVIRTAVTILPGVSARVIATRGHPLAVEQKRSDAGSPGGFRVA